jgi:hypothetical protein
MCDRIPPIEQLLALSRNWYDRSQSEFGGNKNPHFQGPLGETNWLIPGILLVGAYPAPADYHPAEADHYIISLLRAGIDTFVCLNDEYGKNPNHYGYAELEGTLNEDGDDILYDAIGLPGLSRDFNKDRDFIHMPVKDMNTGDSTKIKELCKYLKEKICEGKHIYIHCTGGHGRTGTIAAILLYLLYPTITAEQAIEYVQYAHDQREAEYSRQYFNSQLNAPQDSALKSKFQLGQVPTPQTSAQQKQVKDIIQELRQEMTSAKATASSSEEEYADEDELSGISLDDALKGGRRKNGKSKTKKNKRNKKSRKSRKQRKTRKQTK